MHLWYSFMNGHMLYSALFLIAASIVCAAALPIGAPPGAGICANFTYAKEKTQATLDTKRYAGLWFEQGRSKNFIFDHDCYCTTANYTLEDGFISVANRCRKGSVTGNLTGPTHGKATCPDPKFPAFLDVEFSPFAPKGVYEIAATDYDSYSIIFSCSKTPFFGGSLVWIVTRSNVIDDSTWTNLVHQASNFGLDMSDIVRTQQVGCPAE